MDVPEVLSSVDLARALKDEDYRATLTAEQQAAVSQMISDGELTEEDLEDVAGGSTTKCTNSCVTIKCKAPGVDGSIGGGES